MALPLRYNLRNVLVRWRSTAATLLGIALVVAVYVAVQALAVGLEQASAHTGDPRNLLVVRRGSNAESGSQLTREQVGLIRYAPGVARGPGDRPLASPDIVVVVNLPRRGGAGEGNVTLRGIGPEALALRPQARLVAGRWPVPGQREITVSRRLAARFARMDPGDTLRSGVREMKVVGWFDAGGSAFDSEAWIPAEDVRSLFDRDLFSSVLLRPASPAAAGSMTRHLESDRRLTVQVLPETAYYAEQTKSAGPIRFLGNFLATMMSVGAIFAAMNTMYASVGARTREIGTLRVLGFSRRAILSGILLEGAALAALGGALGCLLAFSVNGLSTGTIGFETFSETVFQFRVSPRLVAEGMIFSAAVGVAGSLLPALRAARLPVIASLKSV